MPEATLEQNKTEDRSLWEKPIKDLLASEGWALISRRLAEYRRESLAKLMTMDCESKVYRTEIRCYDHSLGIPDEILAEALESKRLQAEEYSNRGEDNGE
jgi:hypothetical protein